MVGRGQPAVLVALLPEQLEMAGQKVQIYSIKMGVKTLAKDADLVQKPCIFLDNVKEVSVVLARALCLLSSGPPQATLMRGGNHEPSLECSGAREPQGFGRGSGWTFLSDRQLTCSLQRRLCVFVQPV